MKNILGAVVIALCLFGALSARAQSNCAQATIPNIVSASAYTLSTKDNCGWIVATNLGTITVSLPAPGLIFPPGFTAQILVEGTGALVFRNIADDAGKTHKINGGDALTLTAGQSANLTVLQDFNWYAIPTGGTGTIAAVGNKVTNDAPAIQAALNGLSPGQTAYLDPTLNYRIGGNITIPANVALDCRGNWGLNTATSFSPRSGVWLESAYTIIPSASSRLLNCPIYRFGATFPVQTPADYAGTAITYPASIADDTWISNVQIVGFNLCIDQSNQASRKHWYNIECDGTNGEKIGPSTDTDEISAIRNWPWGTTYFTGGTPTETRSGTGFLFTGTSRLDDLKAFAWLDFGHAIGMDIENPGTSCCNIHLDNIWLDSNATKALVNKANDVTFGKLWVWGSSGPGIVLDGALTTRIDQLYLNGATDCIQLLNGAVIQWGAADFAGCTGQVVNMSASPASRVKGGDASIDPGIVTTPYVGLASVPTATSGAVDISSPRVPSGLVSYLLGNNSLLPLKTIGDEVAPTTGITAPTVVVAGTNQATASLSQSGNLGASLLLKDTAGTANSGGALLFGANSGHMRHFAALKGLLTDGANNTSGDIAVSLRAASTDSTLTPGFWFNHAGYAVLGGANNQNGVAGEFFVPKIGTPASVAPGAGFGRLDLVAGTNAGTCKLILTAGTSNTPVTVIDNVGAGC